MPTCVICGRELRPATRGRPPRYCSRACRARAYRARVADGSAGDNIAPSGPTSDSSADDPAAAKTDLGEHSRNGPGSSGLSLTLSHIVRAATEIADQGGSEAVTMRSTALRLGVGTMSLYRYVAGREELNDLIVDAAYGEIALPEPGPDGWRAKLELSARQEWQLYRDHPWVAQLVAATTRPPLAPNLMAYTDWRIRALDGLELEFVTKVQVAIMVGTYLQSAAVPLAYERRSARATRRTRQQWFDAKQNSIDRILPTARLPMVSQFGAAEYRAAEPANIFEFGLHRMLDGIAALIA
ncbi:TetR/AcrR family transcriptional regulator [Nocardia sp. CA-128927]|uniref:TetR/AcrR family transcriptional regulator n=1 Tax=Nocardia sp. CA-128927 TaxID=3239975 RepID=UPI003D96D544